MYSQTCIKRSPSVKVSLSKVEETFLLTTVTVKLFLKWSLSLFPRSQQVIFYFPHLYKQWHPTTVFCKILLDEADIA